MIVKTANNGSKYADYSFAEAAAALELTEEEVLRLCPDMDEYCVDLGIASERYNQVRIRMLITDGGHDQFMNPFRLRSVQRKASPN
jgi:hypothetical protein